MRPKQPFASARAGFTLIEVLVVVAVVALVAAVSAPLLRKPPRAQLQADATRMAAALRVTRAAAMAQNRAMDFAIDAQRRTYASPVIPASALDPRVEIAGQGGVRFFPSGRSTGADIHLRLDRAAARVQVIWATGHVVIGE
jgi:general secretion pathway protein H